MVIKVMKVLIIPPVVMDSGAGIARQISSDSVSSINSLSSACSMTSQQSAATDGEGRKGAKNSKKKGPEFAKNFETVLPDAFGNAAK